MRNFTDAERWQAFIRHAHNQPTGKAIAFAPPGATHEQVALAMNAFADDLCAKWQAIDDFISRSSETLKTA